MHPVEVYFCIIDHFYVYNYSVFSLFLFVEGVMINNCRLFTGHFSHLKC